MVSSNITVFYWVGTSQNITFPFKTILHFFTFFWWDWTLTVSERESLNLCEDPLHVVNHNSFWSRDIQRLNFSPELEQNPSQCQSLCPFLRPCQVLTKAVIFFWISNWRYIIHRVTRLSRRKDYLLHFPLRLDIFQTPSSNHVIDLEPFEAESWVKNKSNSTALDTLDSQNNINFRVCELF